MVSIHPSNSTVQRAGERFATDMSWLQSRHSFSFGHHYDPANTNFGLLLVNNDDVVAPGTGFDTHPHRDMEIVTWVLSGSLVHQDSHGNNGVIYPGLAQRMSAGTGILHSEKNDSWQLTGANEHDEPVHFVQMWVRPDQIGIGPSYQQRDVNDELAAGGLVPVASGLPRHKDTPAIRIAQPGAGLQVARMAAGDVIELPDAPFLHVFVARGSATVDVGAQVVVLETGDSGRLRDLGGCLLTSGSDGAEILVWEMYSAR